MMRNGNFQQATEQRHAFMMKAVDSLGQMALGMIKGKVEMHQKPDHTRVTTVDIALNQEFIQQVAAQFPDDLVWGEEASNSEKGNLSEAAQNWMWTIDPIDSTSSLWNSYQTKNFRSCVSRILIAGFAPGEKSPCISVIHNPFQSQKMTLYATMEGAFYKSSSMSEPQKVQLQGGPTRLADVRRFEFNTWPGAVPELRKLPDVMPGARRVWHQLFMGSVALGDADISAFPGPSNPHDVAPGAHIVYAAGGTVASLRGEAYDTIDWRLPVAGVVCAAAPELSAELIARMV